jgi:hypothetical protein
MCLPPKSDQSSPNALTTLGIGALVLVACLACIAGPAVAGAAGGVALLGLAVCVALPALTAIAGRAARGTRRASSRRRPAARR